MLLKTILGEVRLQVVSGIADRNHFPGFFDGIRS
jgi:hypothetical protein